MSPGPGTKGIIQNGEDDLEILLQSGHNYCPVSPMAHPDQTSHRPLLRRKVVQDQMATGNAPRPNTLLRRLSDPVPVCGISLDFVAKTSQFEPN